METNEKAFGLVQVWKTGPHHLSSEIPNFSIEFFTGEGSFQRMAGKWKTLAAKRETQVLVELEISRNAAGNLSMRELRNGVASQYPSEELPQRVQDALNQFCGLVVGMAFPKQSTQTESGQ